MNQKETPLDRLSIVKEAAFDSCDVKHEECLNGTRVEVLRQIEEWAKSPHGKCILWINGKAGTGKSTISRTVAARLEQQHRLGASFFFRRGEGDRGTPKRLFPTLVKRLVWSIPQLRPEVEKAIQNQPNISGTNLQEQFEKLLLGPLVQIKQDEGAPTKVVVIDALDECYPEYEKDIKSILQFLANVQQSRSVQLRFLLTSRSDLPVSSVFRNMTGMTGFHQELVLHEISEQVVKCDISLYIEHQFSNLREKCGGLFEQGWPGDAAIEKLIDRAVPLFIAAATLCRFICDQGAFNPEKRLESILSYQSI